MLVGEKDVAMEVFSAVEKAFGVVVKMDDEREFWRVV